MRALFTKAGADSARPRLGHGWMTGGRRFGLLTALALLPAAAWVSACSSEGGTGGGKSQVFGSANADAYVPIRGGVLLSCGRSMTAGRSNPTKKIDNLSMVFRLSPAQRADREALKEAVSDPQSSSYRQFLTSAEYAARFGANPADIERARSWLATQGLELQTTSPLGARVTFGGTVATLQGAFQVELRQYEVNGQTFYAPSTPPKMPADLAPLVLDVSNLHNFYPRANSVPEITPVPEYGSGSSVVMAPPDWSNVYDSTPAYTTGVNGHAITGAGVNIGIVGVAPVSPVYSAAFRTLFGLPANTVNVTQVPMTGAATGEQGGGFEGTLDVEWSGGIGQGAIINFWWIGAGTNNADDATYYMIDNNSVDIISESLGYCEGLYLQAAPNGFGLETSDYNIIDVYGSAANLLGITYIAAAGDQGAAACTPFNILGTYLATPASYPGVTAVGGTEFPAGSLTGSPYFTAYSNTETVWNTGHNRTKPAEGTGGISVLFPRPSYQTNLTTCTEVGTLPVPGVDPTKMRQVPDVSFNSSNGPNPLVAMCVLNSAGNDCAATGGGTPTLYAGGGTSFAAPSFAGVVSLMNQVAGGRLGNINPLLYQLQANAATSDVFHDITTGNNQVSCLSGTDPGCPAGGLYGYAAASGYDCATGLGSIDVYKLLTAMGTMAKTTTAVVASPASTSEGTPISLTATVNVPTPNGHALGGTVTFTFQSYGVGGFVDGGLDESWTLGATNITNGTASGGTAVLSVAIPPGVVQPGTQSVDVVAMYGGDVNHYPSVSSKFTVTFAPLTLAISPANPTVMANSSTQFTATGGTGPMKWYVDTDSTCFSPADGGNPTCATLDETTGAFVAGPVDGQTMIQVTDSFGAEALTTITVIGGLPADGGVDSGGGMVTDSGSPVDSGSPADSGLPPPVDSGTQDSGAHDSGAAHDGGGGSSSSSGCSCKTAGANDDSNVLAASGAIAGILALGLRIRRRRAK